MIEYMKFMDLVEDTGIALLTILFLAVVSSPATYALWNAIVVPLVNHGLCDMTWPMAIGFNFAWNVMTFFKLNKRDIIVASAAMPEMNEAQSETD
jgi:hypothetical protein